jgi:4,5-dihydroxyphthalate decarboxylase
LTDSVALKIAVADYPHTIALKNGSVPIRGVVPEFVNVVPQIAAFPRRPISSLVHLERRSWRFRFS